MWILSQHKRASPSRRAWVPLRWEGWPWAAIPEEAKISRLQPVSLEMLDRVTVVGKEAGHIMWAKTTWLRLCGVTSCWDGRGAGGRRKIKFGGGCVCKSHLLHSLQKEKKVDAHSADISNHGREPGLASQGMPFPFASSASNEQHSLPNHGLEGKVKLIVHLSYSQLFCITCCPTPNLSL